MGISLKYESLKLLLRYPHKKKQASTVPSAFIFDRRHWLAFSEYFLPSRCCAESYIAGVAPGWFKGGASRTAQVQMGWSERHCGMVGGARWRVAGGAVVARSARGSGVHGVAGAIADSKRVLSAPDRFASGRGDAGGGYYVGVPGIG
jgi:hypothetical protein